MYVTHSAGGEILSKRFLQKYLYYAKHRPWQPVLTPSAEGYIAEQYSQWRVDKAGDSRNRRTLPITARTLETMIRLSTAHAKMRMSKTIDVVDSSVAIEIMRFVVEAEGLAPSSVAGDVDTPTEELALTDGEQQGECTQLSDLFTFLVVTKSSMPQSFSYNQPADRGVISNNLPVGISKKKYTMFQKHLKE